MVGVQNPTTLEFLLEQIRDPLSPQDRALIERAYALAEQAHGHQTRASGEPYLYHCLAVAGILAELRLDPPVIAAGLLHDVVEDTGVTLEDIRREFGEEIARLVDGVTKLKYIDRLRAQPEEGETRRTGREEQSAENIRKIFFAMVEDPRVVLIKLADRLHNMRTLGALPPEKQKRIARETLEIYAPLANRLGIWQLKWELEDLAFRYLEPEKYREIARAIDERRAERERHIQQIVERIKARLAEEGIQAEVTGRAKHIYSIYRKMVRKGVPFDQVYDVRAVRIIVHTIPECYQVLGIIHSMWRPIPKEFDDYIANPKDNSYRSLHTAVMLEDGKTLEVQIRTWEMHWEAEYGIAAHWIYKEQVSKRDLAFEKKVAWLRSLLEWRNEVTSAREFVESLKTDVFEDRIYVFTPKGDPIDLPRGSTPVDFAYHIHTELGHRCRGARVNGKWVPLNYVLQMGDQVEIIPAKQGGPSRDWLDPAKGYVKTSRARQKIRQWFKQQGRAENIRHGREILAQEIRRLGVPFSVDEAAKRLHGEFGYKDPEDLLAAIGWGDVSPEQLAPRLIRMEEERRQEERRGGVEPPPLAERPDGSRPVLVEDNPQGLLMQLARCCRPVPGDEVIGYITRNRGITIHRRDCPNILNIRTPERLIEVQFPAGEKGYPVDVEITAIDRVGLLHEISGVLKDEQINIAHITVDTRNGFAIFQVTLEVRSAAQLHRALARIEQIPNVREARRRR
ncbi:MAG: (p)ppGpp synthetase [Thermoflexus sp.]|uniref:RelA/SpoT family protein n=1 Tax=Thermoflexus sp. TaxID=1969742 RepID=UPI0033234D35